MVFVSQRTPQKSGAGYALLCFLKRQEKKQTSATHRTNKKPRQKRWREAK
jgi:hypothetical protein